MIYVLDACALIAYVRGEHGKSVVEDILLVTENRVFLHAINACEVYYDFVRSDGKEIALSVIRDIEMVGVEIRDDADSDLWMHAGDLKAEFKHISLADCFAAALSNRLNAPLVTSDHGEFDSLATRGIANILFIR